MKQTDIEIYVKDTDLLSITNWLVSTLGKCSNWQKKGKVFKCTALAENIPITWYEKAVGNWHCLYIENNKTPWSNDIDCATAANKYLNVELRCAPNNWSEKDGESEEQANQWLKIINQQIFTITWHT